MQSVITILFIHVLDTNISFKKKEKNHLSCQNFIHSLLSLTSTEPEAQIQIFGTLFVHQPPLPGEFLLLSPILQSTCSLFPVHRPTSRSMLVESALFARHLWLLKHSFPLQSFPLPDAISTHICHTLVLCFRRCFAWSGWTAYPPTLPGLVTNTQLLH